MTSEQPWFDIPVCHFSTTVNGAALASLARCSCAVANPAKPLAVAPCAIRLRSVYNPISRSLHFSGTVTGLTLPSAAAFLACWCHCISSL
jgi:hypothetical protein